MEATSKSKAISIAVLLMVVSAIYVLVSNYRAYNSAGEQIASKECSSSSLESGCSMSKPDSQSNLESDISKPFEDDLHVLSESSTDLESEKILELVKVQLNKEVKMADSFLNRELVTMVEPNVISIVRPKASKDLSNSAGE